RPAAPDSVALAIAATPDRMASTRCARLRRAGDRRYARSDGVDPLRPTPSRWRSPLRQIDQLRQPGAVTVRGAERQLVALGPLQVEVCRILPGHPDATVQLHALLGGVNGDPA